jgi:hypothetical protein
MITQRNALLSKTSKRAKTKRSADAADANDNDDNDEPQVDPKLAQWRSGDVGA